MAIQKTLAISFNVQLDGTSTTVSLDLERDSYTIPAALVNDPSVQRANKPTAASGSAAGAPSFTASVAGSIVSLTFGAPGTAGNYLVNLILFY